MCLCLAPEPGARSAAFPLWAPQGQGSHPTPRTSPTWGSSEPSYVGISGSSQTF